MASSLHLFSTNLLMPTPTCISTHLITLSQKQAFHTLSTSVCEDSALRKKTFSCNVAGCLSFSQPMDIPHQSLKMHWRVPNRSPGPVPLIQLHQLWMKYPSSLCFTIHTTSQSPGFSDQTGIFFKTALQLAWPFVIGLWWLSRKIGTYMIFSYTPTSVVMLIPHQAHYPSPLTGARHVPTCMLTPPLEVPMVTCLWRGLSRVRATTWHMPSPVSLATWSMLVRLPGPLRFVSWSWHPPHLQQACNPAL